MPPLFKEPKLLQGFVNRIVDGIACPGWRLPFRGICLNAVSRFRFRLYERLRALESGEEGGAAILTGMLSAAVVFY